MRCEASLLSESPYNNRTGAYYGFAEAFFTGAATARSGGALGCYQFILIHMPGLHGQTEREPHHVYYLYALVAVARIEQAIEYAGGTPQPS
jgi:hypothetical protein